MVQGIWLGRDRAENRREIEAALALVHRHPGTLKALIVGNETLLRGELPAGAVKAYVEEVGKRSDLPVTYADVWEFWLKAPELASAVDFVTIHILPYWEDDPVGASGRRRPCAGGSRETCGGVPRKADMDRRGGLAEQGPHARRRPSLSAQPGPLPERRGSSRQGR